MRRKNNKAIRKLFWVFPFMFIIFITIVLKTMFSRLSSESSTISCFMYTYTLFPSRIIIVIKSHIAKGEKNFLNRTKGSAINQQMSRKKSMVVVITSRGTWYKKIQWEMLGYE